jgi:Glycosyl transferase family 2
MEVVILAAHNFHSSLTVRVLHCKVREPSSQSKGSSENAMSKIAIGIVTNGRKVELSWSMAMVKMFTNSPLPAEFFVSESAQTEKSIPLLGEAGGAPGGYSIHAIARKRQQIAEECVAKGFEYLFFLDDDILCSDDTLQLLLEPLTANPEAMICGGIYTGRRNQYPVPWVYQDFECTPMYEFPVGEVFTCKALANGCMLIRTKVFEYVKKPWFDFQDGGGGAEDIRFCAKVDAAGFTILAHGGVLPGHIGQDGKINTIALTVANPEIGYGRMFRL